MASKTFKTNSIILKDLSVKKEVKIFVILDMLHDGSITLKKAWDLCTETGIFSDHWVAIDGETTDIFSKIYKSI